MFGVRMLDSAKIKIRRTKSNKLHVELFFDNGKRMPVQNFEFDESMDGKECLVEREKGQIVKIVIDGEEYTSIKHKSKNKKSSKKDVNKFKFEPENKKLAKAPYNFVPLNNKVVSWQEPPSFDIYHRDRLSGYIDLEIETKTPLYIRRESEDESFFSIDGKVKIPGSSIRGMVRTLVEIVSFGKFNSQFSDDKNDKRLYYRDPATSPLKETYVEYFTTGDSKDSSIGLKMNVHSGLLRKNGSKYVIYPSSINNGVQYYRVDGMFYGDKEFVLKSNQHLRMDVYSFRKIFFVPVGEKVHSHRGGRVFLKYALVEEVSETPQDSRYKEGYLICSGHSPRKHMQWIINVPDKSCTPIEVENKVIEEYREDTMRSEKVDVLRILDKDAEEVPVFYIKREGKVIAFGHTGFFRLPYELSIGDHIPQDLKSNQTVDFAESIFGVEDRWATRVYFEDANVLEGQGKIFLKPTSPKILSSPKPTTFQHYLEQPQGESNLKHWGDKYDENGKMVKIRGYKLYWHRNTPSKGEYGWSEEEIIRDPQHCIITPVREGVKFRGRIRFENLSKEELGALLFVLDLPSNHYHKLGMGKPLGLGSVEITPTLYTVNRKERYKKLFSSGNGWNTAEAMEDNVPNYKRVFEEYVLRKIGRNNTRSLWDVSRLKELKAILNWENTQRDDWLEKTRYMLIECEVNKYDCICKPKKGKDKCNEFSNRPVLPKPREVVK